MTASSSILKIALPALIGVVLAFLFFAPLEDKQEVSFLLDKNKVADRAERLRVAALSIAARTMQGRPFVLSARSAVQQTSAIQVVDISDMNAQIQLERPGPARRDRRAIRHGRDQVDVVGPDPFTPPTAYRWARTTSTSICATTPWPAAAPSRARCRSASSAPASSRSICPNRRVVLTGRARLHIVQGGLR
jgi:lipopolysaccharide export system protein LptC